MSKPITTDEMVAMMCDPRYSRDPEFRREVERRVAGGVTHGGRVNGNSGVIDFGRRGAAHSAGGVSVKIGSEHRESGGVTRASVDPTAIYEGAGFHSAEQIREAFADPRYGRDPAFRAQVAAAVELMGPKSDFKV